MCSHYILGYLDFLCNYQSTYAPIEFLNYELLFKWQNGEEVPEWSF